MNQFHVSKLALALLASGLVLLQNQAQAGGEGFSASTNTKETVDTNTDLGLGKYSANPFHISVTVRGGYDDNVNLSSFDQRESAFTNVGLGLTYQFGSPRTRIDLNAGVSATYYWDQGNNQFNNSSDDWAVNAWLGLSITHKASARLTLSAQVNAAYITTPGFDTFNNLLLSVDQRNQNYFETQDKFSVGYAWAPRFSTLTSYTFAYINYDDPIVSIYEDRFEHTFGNEFRFLWLPTTTLVGEYRFGLVNYTEASNRDSQSNYFLAGFDHSFSPRFNMSFRGGVEVRNFDENFDPVFGNVGDTRTAPYGELTVNYALGQATSLSWFNRYSLEQPNVPEALTSQTYRTTFTIRHAFTARISAGLNLGYEHDAYDQTVGIPAFDQNSFTIGIWGRYAINRNWAIDVGYNYTDVSAPAELFRDYTRNQYWVGATFTW